MKRIQAPILILTIFVTMFAGYLFPTIAAAEMDDYWVGKVVSVQGNVQVRKAGAVDWAPVRLNDTYAFGDMIRVQVQSRAAVVLRNGAILRLDQNTTITFSASEREEETSLLDLLRGAAHFFSPTPRKLKVTTPFVNATVDGTEFFLRVERNQTLLSVFEGRVAAINEAGSLVLASGQSATARTGQAPVSQVVIRPRDAVQWALYYPPILDYQPADFPGVSTTDWQAMVRKSIGFFWKGDLAGAFSSIKKTPDDIRDPRFFTYRAALHLSVGRVDNASTDIEMALALDSDDSHAFALQSIIAVAQNRKKQALDLASKAVDLAPESSAARVALSYTQQAHFDIKSALVSLKEAAKFDPENALVRAREAELQLSLGNLNKAVAAARQAVRLNPDIARTQTVLGFAYLTKIKTRDAKNAFKKAIKLDQAAPLPRLGLGLAKIREGDLKQGRSEMEIAASLDPDNSLIRSYLGKAYFEEKRDKKASTQLAMAKELDPLDPTPWFYDAIRKQTINRPVEALQDLQKSIELNDNRAVYRSRMLLDEDLAARSASLGRIYSDLGFQQLALVEGWNSVNTDPGNYSAHRLLADSYAVLPRHEIARVSELLQSQLLQPINITPVQPNFAETNLLILEEAGPANSSYNEFSTLFNSDRIALQASGVVGENTTLGNEIVLSGVWGRGSYSLGQFHYKTDGFRENNDLDHDICDLFAQVAVTPKISIQAEYRLRDTKRGDPRLNFDPDKFFRDDRFELREHAARIGARFAPSPQSDFIVSLIYSDREEERDLFRGAAEINVLQDDEGGQAEGQFLYRANFFNLTTGLGTYEIDVVRRTHIITPYRSPAKTKFTREQDTIYSYANINFPESLICTVGLAYVYYEQQELDLNKLYPKLGLQWNITENFRMRLAAFRTLKRALVVDQTIEPTQVAGFNQFFDDINGSEIWRYGIGVDADLSDNIYAGMEVSRRDLEVPFGLGSPRFVIEDQREDLYRAYLYWTPHRYWAVRAEYQFEKVELLDESNGRPTGVDTTSVPLTLRYFSTLGFFAELGATYVHQDVDPAPTETFEHKSDDFVLVDAAIGYRLPNRWGIISLEARNLFDKEFLFQDQNYRTSRYSTNPRFTPGQTILGRITFSF